MLARGSSGDTIFNSPSGQASGALQGPQHAVEALFVPAEKRVVTQRPAGAFVSAHRLEVGLRDAAIEEAAPIRNQIQKPRSLH